LHLQRVKHLSTPKGSSLEKIPGPLILAQGFKRVVQAGFYGANRDVHGVSNFV
jgi:hypothetical protein